MNNWKKILNELSYRVSTGIPDLTNEQHLMKLWDILKEHNWNIDARVELLKRLDEQGKERPCPICEAMCKHGETSKKTGCTPASGQASQVDKPSDTTQSSTSGVSSESINSFDGEEKNATMNGDDPPPGTESSAVAEIGVGYAMGCLSENNNDTAKAEKCLEKKLSETKLGDKHGTGDSKKEMRRGMLQSAKRENQKVREINEELGWENSKTAHLGGSQASLKASVDKLKELGIKEVNGMPINEYEKIILGGGGGENPTDTMVCVVNEETGEAIMYHTSNKMTSKDIISNGSPAKEIREVVAEAKDYTPEQRKEAEKVGREARENIGKHRADQKKYIQQQQDKMIEDSQDPKVARRAIDRLKGVKDSVTTAADQQKYWKAVTGHPRTKDFIKEKGYDKNNLTPEQEVEVYQFYVQEMQNISNMDNPPEDRRSGGVGDADIQIMTRLYGEGEEQKTTGKDAREPIFDNKEMQSFYDKQTGEMNTLREKMNKINPGSGDKAFADRMAKRLHLDLAEGHNPGGIPNDKVETVMGVYDYKDLKQDSEGNMVQKKGSKFYKLDKDGNITDEEVKQEDTQDFDCSVVADKGTMNHCLGMKDGDKASDDIGIKMGEYEGTKAIIYDRNGNQIGVQTARSKSGPGGAMQDTIQYHKDFQKCLAKQTKIQGKCG